MRYDDMGLTLTDQINDFMKKATPIVVSTNASNKTSLWESINKGIAQGGGTLVNYYNTQEAVNAAQGAANAAKYGSTSQTVATASSNISSMLVPLLGIGAFGLVALMAMGGRRK